VSGEDLELEAGLRNHSFRRCKVQPTECPPQIAAMDQGFGDEGPGDQSVDDAVEHAKAFCMKMSQPYASTREAVTPGDAILETGR
jgi:hypothetical protein